jgi:hypothetical protein
MRLKPNSRAGSAVIMTANLPTRFHEDPKEHERKAMHGLSPERIFVRDRR